MRELGRAADRETRIYLVGGATAVLMGWRVATVDVDCVMRPESEAVLRAIPELKERLHVNIELASPHDFIPVPEGWEDRSVFIARVGDAAFYHYDLYAQALAKVERGHARDVQDVREMLRLGLISGAEARARFERIRPELFRYPAVDEKHFAAAVADMFPA